MQFVSATLAFLIIFHQLYIAALLLNYLTMKKRFTYFFKLGFEKRTGFLLCKGVFYLTCITGFAFAKSDPYSLGSDKIIKSYSGEHIQNQDIPITGTVRDETGALLPVVSVTIK
jgi:hypothetical protein